MNQLRVKPEISRSMKCRDAELMIMDFPFRLQPSGVPAELSEHLASCVSCNRFYNGYSSDLDALNAGRRVVPDHAFFDRLSTNLQTHTDQPRRNLKPLRRILHFSPAILTAAASVILGIWIGSKWFILTQAGIETAGSLPSEDRSGMVEAFASEMQLTDESTLALESYFIENENSDNYDAK